MHSEFRASQTSSSASMLSLVSVRSIEIARPFEQEDALFRLAPADVSPEQDRSGSFARIDWTAVGAAAFVYAIAFAAWVLLAR